jgi:hypothetical protein
MTMMMNATLQALFEVDSMSGSSGAGNTSSSSSRDSGLLSRILPLIKSQQEAEVCSSVFAVIDFLCNML